MLAWLAVALVAQAADEVDLGVDGHAYNPVWSPDGGQLVVEVNRHQDEAQLWLVDLLGAERPRRVDPPGQRNPFSGAPSVAMAPTWHGEGFLFEGTDPAGHFRLYRAGERAVTAVIDDASLPGNLTFPSVSGDGTVAFVGDATGVGQLYTWRDGALEQRTRTPVPEMFPWLSADGSLLVFSRKVGDTEDLFRLDLATGSEEVLAGGAGDQTRPVAAGASLLFFDGGRGGGRWDLIALAPDGTRRVLGRDVRLPLRARPAVSPDGRWVAFIHDGADRDDRVVLAAVDGSRRVEVLTGHVSCGEPAIGVRDGRIWLAWTGLPAADAGWRRVAVEDVTRLLR